MSTEAVWAESMEEQPMRGDKWRDVGCQWEEPDEGGGAGGGTTREVGCQGGVIMIDVAIQVDLRNNTDLSVLVKPQKRKRGRPRKCPSVCVPPAPPSPQEEEEEEGEEEEEESGGGRGAEGGEEERRGGVEDDSDPTWKPVHVTRHRVIGRKVIGSYRRYIKVEEGEEPEEEPGRGGGARKRRRRGRRRNNAEAMEEEEEEEPGEQEDQDGAADSRTPGGVVCEVCGKVMSCRTNLARHAITHTGLQPFPCPVCGQRFNRYSNQQSHIRRMHSGAESRPRGRRGGDGAQSWLCEMCGKSFNCHSRLRIHVMGHNGVKPYGCHLCPKTYVSAADLYKHIRKVHEEGTTVRYSGGPLLCDRCGREFKCRSLLVAHYRTHTGERPFHCDMCTLKFARPHLLRRHKANVHAEGRTRVRSEVNLEEERPFVCQVCGKRLKTLVQLESHVRVHTDERPHSCSVCLRGFSSNRTLRQHQLTVHAEGAERRTPTRKAANDARKSEKEEPETPSPYVCPTCGRDFKFRSTLALHSVTHTKERPHACDLCPQRFGLLGHLKRHREDVHPDGKAGPKEARVFSCPICAKTFRKSRLRLERHMTSVHNQPGQVWVAPVLPPPPSSFSKIARGDPAVVDDNNGVGTIIMVTVPGNENQDGPEEEGEGDSGRTDGDNADTHHAVVSVTPRDDTDTQHDVTVTPADDTVTQQHEIMTVTTPPDHTDDTQHDITAVTPPDDTDAHHHTVVAVTPLDDEAREVTHPDSETTPTDEVTPLDAHHNHSTHHVIAVTQADEGDGGYAQIIQVTQATPDGGYAHMMGSDGEAVGYAQIIEAVSQPDVTEADMEVTQADVTGADVVEVTGADVVEVTGADVMEVTGPDGYAQETIIIEVTQHDGVEEVFVPPPT